MDLIEQIDNKLNGNHYLMNVIFSYLGESPSAKVMGSILNDAEIKEWMNNKRGRKIIYSFGDPRRLLKNQIWGVSFSFDFFTTFNKYKNEGFVNEKKHIRNFKTPKIMDVKRCKVDIMEIGDDDDCIGRNCVKCLSYWERSQYGEYCENCYARMMRLRVDSDSEDEFVESDIESEADY
jgi:hypothetical protein